MILVLKKRTTMKGIKFILLKASTTAIPGGIAREGVYASVVGWNVEWKTEALMRHEITLPTLTSYLDGRDGTGFDWRHSQG